MRRSISETQLKSRSIGSSREHNLSGGSHDHCQKRFMKSEPSSNMDILGTAMVLNLWCSENCASTLFWTVGSLSLAIQFQDKMRLYWSPQFKLELLLSVLFSHYYHCITLFVLPSPPAPSYSSLFFSPCSSPSSSAPGSSPSSPNVTIALAR